MKLPNGHLAMIDAEKLTGYLLSENHPRGRHKLRIFTAVFGFTSSDAERLRRLLMEAARDGDVVGSETIAFGTKYEVHFSCRGRTGAAVLLSVWLLTDGAGRPRLITAYPL